MTSKEKAAYSAVYLDNLDTAHDSIALHKARLKAPDITPEEEAEIDTHLPTLHMELAKLKAKFSARKRSSVAISPPTDAQVKKAQDMADETDRLIAKQADVSRAFDLAKAAGELMQKIQPVPA